MKSCWTCKHCINDYFATGTLDCKKFDDMTEEEIDNYYTNNGGENCIYYEGKFDMEYCHYDYEDEEHDCLDYMECQECPYYYADLED